MQTYSKFALVILLISSLPSFSDNSTIDSVISDHITLTETTPSQALFKQADPSIPPSKDIANRLLGFTSSYSDDPTINQIEPNANLLLLISDNFENNIHQDPFYLFGNNNIKEFPYQEQAWNALGTALRTKYKLIMEADKIIKNVQNATTLSYYSESGVFFKIRPAIEDISSLNQIRLKMALSNLDIVDKIEGKIGTQDIRIALIKQKMIKHRLTEFQVVYLGQNNGPNTTYYENIGEITFRVPFW